MKFSTDIRVPQRVNSNDSDDPLTFYLVPPASQSFRLSSEISQHVLDQVTKFCTDIHGSQMMYPKCFSTTMRLTFVVLS